MVNDVFGVMFNVGSDFEFRKTKHGSIESSDTSEIDGSAYPIMDITNLTAFAPGQGTGSAMMQAFLDKAKDINIPIMLSAQSHFTCEDTSKEVFDEEQAKLIAFYEKHGFKSINDFVRYERREAMLYVGDPSGKAIYDKIIRIQEEHKIN